MKFTGAASPGFNLESPRVHLLAILTPFERSGICD